MRLLSLVPLAALGMTAALPSIPVEVWQLSVAVLTVYVLTTAQQALQANPVCPEAVERYCWNEGMTKAPPETMLWFISCEKNVWTCLYIKPGNFDPTALLPPNGPYSCTSAAPGAEAVRCANTGVGWKGN